MKKLISILLSMVLLTTVLTVGVSAETEAITRGETAELIREMLPPHFESPTIYDAQIYFLDVNGEHRASHPIMILKDLNIIVGDGNGCVRPDEPILFEESAVMFVRMLGYESLATEKGGYPNGYIKIAEEIGLLKGVEKTAGEYADEQTVKTMYDNALDIPKRLVTEYDVSNGAAVYSTEHGITYRKDMAEYVYRDPGLEYPKVTIRETDNFDSHFIKPVTSMGFIKEELILEENHSAICIEFNEITNPSSNYYVSLYRRDEENQGYVLKYFGPVSVGGFTLKGLEGGGSYRTMISSSMNYESATGRIYSF